MYIIKHKQNTRLTEQPYVTLFSIVRIKYKHHNYLLRFYEFIKSNIDNLQYGNSTNEKF